MKHILIDEAPECAIMMSKENPAITKCTGGMSTMSNGLSCGPIPILDSFELGAAKNFADIIYINPIRSGEGVGGLHHFFRNR